MDDETHDYKYYMAQAAKYREMADNDDGSRRRILLRVAYDMEAKANKLMPPVRRPNPNTE